MSQTVGFDTLHSGTAPLDIDGAWNSANCHIEIEFLPGSGGVNDSKG